jgi:hypothetical protein
MDVLAEIVVWLNTGANAIGRFLLAPIGMLPGWLSATLVAVLTGVLLLIVFKYTSSQRMIRRVRGSIQAHLLSLKLFKDSARVALRAQGGILLDAGRLLLLAIVPILVMAAPVALLLGQLSLWYQSPPLRLGEEAMITMTLNGDAKSPWPEVHLQQSAAVETTVGPVRVLSNKRELYWNIKAREKGYHRLVFQVDGQPTYKILAVGDGLMRVSAKRPDWNWLDILENPAEEPFRPGSSVQSIEIAYPECGSWTAGVCRWTTGWLIDPERSSWTRGAYWWMIDWFVASTIAALCFRRMLNVHV